VTTHIALLFVGSVPQGPLFGSSSHSKLIVVSRGTAPFQVIVRVAPS
jgi:hypothetical protein